MSNVYKTRVLDELRRRFGEVHRLSGSQSLFSVGADAAIVYFRYSKVHEGGKTFFGLRDVDLKQLEGRNSFVCFLLDDGTSPVLIPYADFEAVFRASDPASDGQHKVQLISQDDTWQLYIAKQGRFSVEGYIGLALLEQSLDATRLRPDCGLSHSQVQSLLAGVGHLKGYDVRVPDSDIGRLDWAMTPRFTTAKQIPSGFDEVSNVLSEVDVLWIGTGSNRIEGLFEVEHSTPVYSGLLRFNDILLTEPRLSRFHIVANDLRRAVFSRQISRPTFRKSGLSELVSFLEYANVLSWHARLIPDQA
ncbi:MAG: hypothetical protein ACE5F9_06600 [Phycisphaerae bacterium]